MAFRIIFCLYRQLPSAGGRHAVVEKFVVVDELLSLACALMTVTGLRFQAANAMALSCNKEQLMMAFLSSRRDSHHHSSQHVITSRQLIAQRQYLDDYFALFYEFSRVILDRHHARRALPLPASFLARFIARAIGGRFPSSHTVGLQARVTGTHRLMELDDFPSATFFDIDISAGDHWSASAAARQAGALVTLPRAFMAMPRRYYAVAGWPS